MRRLVLRKRERIAIARRRLNEDWPKIDHADNKATHWFILGCINVLDGDETALNAAERNLIREMRADWLRLRR